MADFLERIEGHIPALRRFARGLTRDAERADDLVQDCLERAIRHRRLWRPGGALKSWLLRIMLNIWRNDLRAARSRPRLVAVDDPATPPAQTAALELAELMRAVAALPPEQRAALLLVAVEGLSYAEAANLLNIPRGTLMSRLYRARRALAAATGHERGGGGTIRSVK
ncbi:MAG TPA: sigma-70 family RNA polymerase sigma factor [Thermopetrobacter sp.]|nr:sigma-70 family RNA polymerase sigma factor [Thermopetrobacter sp.]